jgi:hypothetical protein
VTKEIKEEIKKFLESNENENTKYQNLWYIDEMSSKRIKMSIMKTEASQLNNLMMTLSS